MEAPGVKEINCRLAGELWSLLAPESPLSPVPARFIFRGQADATWALVPSALRLAAVGRAFGVDDATESVQINREKTVLRAFVQACDTQGLHLPNDGLQMRRALDPSGAHPEELIMGSSWPSPVVTGLMALAQHHGIPTRLLDWTRRSHVAAYFAAAEALRQRAQGARPERIAIWGLNRKALLELADEPQSIGPGARWPRVKVVVTPGATSHNLSAQGGVFTIREASGVSRDPVDVVGHEDEFLSYPETVMWKLTLPVDESQALLDLCSLYGVTAASLFPGYDGAAQTALVEAARSDTTLFI